MDQGSSRTLGIGRRIGLGIALACALGLVTDVPRAAAQAGSATGAGGTSGGGATDIGWPRQVADGADTITIYQPQLDAWTGNALTGRAAVSVATQASPTPIFGVVWFSARTDVDRASRIVTLDDLKITRSSFPTRPDQAAGYVQALESAFPAGARTIALDRLEANLAVTQAQQGSGPTVHVQNQPPRIVFSEQPAILVLVDGAPALRPVEGADQLARVINTRALLLLDQSSGAYFLFVMDRWASAGSLDGPWTLAADPPASLAAAKAAAVQGGQVDLLTDSSSAAKADLARGVLPAIYVATGAAELLQTDGPPDFQPVASTSILAVQNTTSDIFLDTGSQTYFVLISGRWFESKSLTAGPWTFVAADALPAGFAQIPWQNTKGAVLTSVAGTPQAAEAKISATVPQTATVKRSEAQMPPPQYDGAPKFQPVEGTSLRYAANTATPVIETSPGAYYAVVNGVWFSATSPEGPWILADAVPPAIYTIPPSSPLYYVTYVKVYGATPEVVYVGYLPGYYGTYVAPTGTVVYGTGYVYPPWIGSVWIGPPYTYGFGAGFAWGAFTGFALGYAAGAYCHPWWGPVGWGSAWGWGSTNVHVNVNETNIYNRWGKSTVVSSGGRYAGHVGNTTFAGTKGGDVYAGHDGNVYRRDDGSWQKYDDGSWNDVQARQKAQDQAQARTQDRTGEAQGASVAQDRDAALQDRSAPGAGSSERPLGERGGGSDDGLSSLDRDWQARQAGDQRWGSFSQARSAGDFDRGAFGGDRFGGGFQREGFDRGGWGGGDRGGGFRGGGFRR